MRAVRCVRKNSRKVRDQGCLPSRGYWVIGTPASWILSRMLGLGVKGAAAASEWGGVGRTSRLRRHARTGRDGRCGRFKLVLVVCSTPDRCVRWLRLSLTSCLSVDLFCSFVVFDALKSRTEILGPK